MVLISAEPFFRFVHFYAWFLFSREQNGSYFRAHIKNAKIWTRVVLKRENEVRAKKWTFTVWLMDLWIDHDGFSRNLEKTYTDK